MTRISKALSVYLVDDEPLAIARLRRMLADTGRVTIAGSAVDPEEALEFLSENSVDGLFLDIQMPGMNGFELLGKLARYPPVVFTTAFDRYALRAFEVNSVDYLLKPVEAAHLDRALTKLEHYQSGTAPPDIRVAVERLAASLAAAVPEYPDRLPSRVGDRVRFVPLADVTHVFARDKLTYAATAARDFVIDSTIAELESRLDPRRFTRIHRSVLLNVEFIGEVVTGLSGRMTVRLRDGKHTELTVSRDRVRDLRERLGF